MLYNNDNDERVSAGRQRAWAVGRQALVGCWDTVVWPECQVSGLCIHPPETEPSTHLHVGPLHQPNLLKLCRQQQERGVRQKAAAGTGQADAGKSQLLLQVCQRAAPRWHIALQWARSCPPALLSCDTAAAQAAAEPRLAPAASPPDPTLSTHGAQRTFKLLCVA